MPSVHEALQRLDREIAVARQQKHALLKLVHGYGSTGVGGDIRIAVQNRLHDLAESGQIRGCIFGENWSKTDESTWRLLQKESALKDDPDFTNRDQAYFFIGESLMKLNRPKEALPFYDKIVTEFGQSERLEAAKKRVDEIKNPPAPAADKAAVKTSS